MSTGNVLGSRKLTVDRGLAKPLVGRELIRHQSQGRVGLEGDEAGAQNTRNVCRR